MAEDDEMWSRYILLYTLTVCPQLCMEYVQGSNLNQLVNEEGKSFAFEVCW